MATTSSRERLVFDEAAARSAVAAFRERNPRLLPPPGAAVPIIRRDDSRAFVRIVRYDARTGRVVLSVLPTGGRMDMDHDQLLQEVQEALLRPDFLALREFLPE